MGHGIIQVTGEDLWVCYELHCLDLCRHMYTCTCPDYSAGHLCKHVHRVHSIWLDTYIQAHDDPEPTSEDDNVSTPRGTQVVMCTHVITSHYGALVDNREPPNLTSFADDSARGIKLLPTLFIVIIIITAINSTKHIVKNMAGELAMKLDTCTSQSKLKAMQGLLTTALVTLQGMLWMRYVCANMFVLKLEGARVRAVLLKLDRWSTQDRKFPNS